MYEQNCPTNHEDGWVGQSASPAERDGIGKPSDSSLGKRDSMILSASGTAQYGASTKHSAVPGGLGFFSRATHRSKRWAILYRPAARDCRLPSLSARLGRDKTIPPNQKTVGWGTRRLWWGTRQRLQNH